MSAARRSSTARVARCTFPTARCTTRSAAPCWKRRGGSANPNSRLNNVTDFILWYARGADYTIEPAYTRDDDNTRAIRAFNAMVATDDRVEAVMLPIADGLTLCRKK